MKREKRTIGLNGRGIWNWSILCVFLGLAVACGGSDGNDDPQPGEPGEEGTLVLKADRDTVDNSGYDAVNFTVWLGDKDVTAASSVVNQVTHEEVKSNTFLPTEKVAKGAYTFKATYKSKESAAVKVTVINGESYAKHLFMMYFTSVFCNKCPLVTRAIAEEIIPMSPGRVDVMALHGDMSNVPDPFTLQHTHTLLTKFNLPGYPSIIIDHETTWNALRDEEQFKESLGEIGLAGIALKSSVDANRKLAVEVRVKSRKDFEQPCTVVVVLVEDNLYSQMTTFDWVVRNFLTDIYGDKESTGTGSIGRNKEWSRTFHFALPDTYKTENMRVLAYVLDAEGKALNSRQVKLGGQVDFEIVND